MVSFIIIAVANKILWSGGGIRPPQLYGAQKSPVLIGLTANLPLSVTKTNCRQPLRHISIFPKSGGWVNCCDANFVTFCYRFFCRSITHNNISLRTKKVILNSLPQPLGAIRSCSAKYGGSARKQNGYSTK